MPSPSLRADDPCPRRRRAGTAAAHRHGVWTLPTGPAAPGHARRIVRRHLRRWRLEHAADVVELLVSELVTNALLHGDGPAVLSLRATHGGLRCAVTDDGAASPRPLPQSPDSETGRDCGWSRPCPCGGAWRRGATARPCGANWRRAPAPADPGPGPAGSALADPQAEGEARPPGPQRVPRQHVGAARPGAETVLGGVEVETDPAVAA